MREITTHHDGFGLNEHIQIVANEPGPGGAAHHYIVSYNTAELPALNYIHLFDVDFQTGPRNVEGSKPGITAVGLLALLRDHLDGFQQGEFRNRETACAITHIDEAMHWLEARAKERAKRGVLGTYQK